MAYKGMMLTGIPNFAFTVGYTNASWTLKADLVSAFVCRLLRYMDNRGYDVAVPVNEDPAWPGGRCWTSPRATCCGPSTSSRGRATAPRGGSA